MSVLTKGQRVDKYEVMEEIGGGGMAVVYKVRHTILDTCFALKVLDTARRDSAEVRERFLAEGRIAARLAHPNIVRVTDTVATEEVAGLVMELVTGQSLEDFIATLAAPPTADLVRSLMLPVLDAVGYAHRQGIIHRDLKPANILLLREGTAINPKVTDFGIAKIADGAVVPKKASTRADARMGTLRYMSPEQVRRAKEVTPRSDIFSLGATIYELATRRAAFDSGGDGDSDYEVMERIVNGTYPPPESAAPVAPEIAAAIRCALDPDPARRFASCADFAAALQPGSGVACYPAPVKAASGPQRSSTSGFAEAAAVPAPAPLSPSAPLAPVRPQPPAPPARSEPAAVSGGSTASGKRGFLIGLTVGGIAVAAMVAVLVVRGSGPTQSATGSAGAPTPAAVQGVAPAPISSAVAPAPPAPAPAPVATPSPPVVAPSVPVQPGAAAARPVVPRSDGCGSSGSRDPAQAAALNKRAYAVYKKGDFLGAAALWGQVLDADPGQEMAYGDRSFAYLRAGRHRQCIGAAERCVACVKTDKILGACLYNKGVCHEKLGEKAAAISAYETSLQHRENATVRKDLEDLRR